MTRTLVLVTALLASTAAGAQSISTVCGRSSCSTVFYGGGFGPAKIIDVPPQTDSGAPARAAKWEAYCHPRVVQTPPDGVRRYVYDHAGCENGRSE